MLGRVSLGSAKDVDRAVIAAEKAQPAWAALGPSKRAEYLKKLSNGLAERAEEILHVEVMDTGNTITKMRDDVKKAIDLLKFFAGMGYEVKGQTVPSTPGNLHLTVREPYGVVGRIIPFNHPINFAASRMAAPLIAGNAIIEKPSEQSPLSAAILAEVAAEVMPKGIVNIITGTGAGAGDALVRHPRVKRIAFIGSVKTGMAIQRSAAEVAVKHVTLELGGKNPMIIFPDADSETALSAADRGHELRLAGPVLLFHQPLFRPRVDLRQVRRRSRRTCRQDHRRRSALAGQQDGPDQLQGPVRESPLLHQLRQGRRREAGGRWIASGRRLVQEGLLAPPDRVRRCHAGMRIAQEEIFGPVLSVFKWKHLERRSSGQLGRIRPDRRDLDQASTRR